MDETFARIATDYYWPGYYRDVCWYVATCQVCQAHKSSHQAPAGLMTERNLEGPWIVVASDIMGPKPPSRAGNRYIIVFEDLFNRYVVLKALRKANATSVLKAFEELIVNRWGCPRVLLTDNGTEFCNRMIIEWLNEYGILQSTIPPYHAQANSVERVNRNLRPMMNSFLANDHRDWDVHLNELRFALNSAVHSSLGVYPAFLNLGRNPVPSILLRNHIENPIPTSPPDLDKWKTRTSRVPALQDLVRRHMDKARQVRNCNKNRREVLYQIGDLVRRQNHVLSSAEDRLAAKEAPRFVGPAKVVQVYSPVVYLMEDLDSQRRTKVFVNDLKKYTPSRGMQQLEAQATATGIVVSDSRDVVRGHSAPPNRACSPPRAPGTAKPSARLRGRPKRISPYPGVPTARTAPLPGLRANSPPSTEGAAPERP